MPTDIYQIKVEDTPVYILTHAGAVEGLAEKIEEQLSGVGVGSITSVNGKTGVVVLDANDVGALPSTLGTATSTANGLMAKNDKGQLDRLAVFDFVKVGEVNG